MQTFTGSEYLAIDIASNFGLDKRSWKDRLIWFNERKHELHELVKWAENPALFYAGILAWEATQRAEPTGYTISLDATSSGLQILAVLAGDRSAAQLCNVVPTSMEPAQFKRMDAYTAIYDHMLNKVGEGAKIKREDVKQAVMTSLYGSQAVPKEVFGEGELLNQFLESMIELAPGAWKLNELFLNIWDDQALSNDWVLPDNFHVHVKVMGVTTEKVHFLNEPFDVVQRINAPVEKGRSLGANVVHSLDGMIVREMVRRCNYDLNKIRNIYQLLECPVWALGACDRTEDDKMVIQLWRHYQDSGYLSARILDHLNGDNFAHVKAEVIHKLLKSLPEKPFPVLTIHDCFRCHPNYGNDLRQQYANQLYEIGNSNMLNFLLSQIMHKPVNLNKIDPTMHLDILNSEYALS